MGYIKDPDGVVLYVEHRQPTPEEDREVSEYIARYRQERLFAQGAVETPAKKKSPRHQAQGGKIAMLNNNM